MKNTLGKIIRNTALAIPLAAGLVLSGCEREEKTPYIDLIKSKMTSEEYREAKNFYNVIGKNNLTEREKEILETTDREKLLEDANKLFGTNAEELSYRDVLFLIRISDNFYAINCISY